MAKYVVIGKGYIGTALKEELERRGEEVGYYPTEDTKTIFYMGGPTHMDFNKNIDYHRAYVGGVFNALLSYCVKTKTRLVFTSSALVYEPQTAFSEFKLYMEARANKELPNSLALRIFPVYGREKGKKNKTAIAQFCDAAKEGKTIALYGNGDQTRDFIHIDDVIWHILEAEKCQTTGRLDVGLGNPTSFNDILSIIRDIMREKDGLFMLAVKHVPASPDYQIKGVECQRPLPARIELYDGIRKELLEQ